MAPERLWQQVLRWRPWVLMLMAGWFECRGQQTGDEQFSGWPTMLGNR
ncbi:Thiamine kinase [Kluyvera cryocrescens]|uniref:Thiamine kinase n=1 Tax=Kluyvera cryocrescens TaxID=580 RepID=A0A485A1G5_KLUCR|nr:Thiamine kinase [Kluyvera cryocrescens]